MFLPKSINLRSPSPTQPLRKQIPGASSGLLSTFNRDCALIGILVFQIVQVNGELAIERFLVRRNKLNLILNGRGHGVRRGHSRIANFTTSNSRLSLINTGLPILNLLKLYLIQKSSRDSFSESRILEKLRVTLRKTHQ